MFSAMVKRLLSVTLILLVSFVAFANSPMPNKGELLKNAQQTMSKIAVKTQVESDQSASTAIERPDPGQTNQLIQLLTSEEKMSEAKITNIGTRASEKFSAAPSKGIATVSSTPLYSKAPAAKTRAGAPKIVTGTLISKDLRVDGSIHSLRQQLTATDETGVYTLSNCWGMDSLLTVKINTETGEVSIAPRVIYRHNTYGNISMVPLIVNGNRLALAQGDLKGQVGADGRIELGAWGVVVTETTEVDGQIVPGQYYGQVYDYFTGTSLLVPNTEVSGMNVSKNEIGMYQCYIEQTEDNIVNFYGFHNISMSDAVTARLTSAKTIVMSPQNVFNNAMYGPFCNYPATFTYNTTTQKWSFQVNAKGNMIFTDQGQGIYKLPGFVIAQRLSPSQMVSAGYHELTVITDADINYPATPQFNLKGAGTAENPFLIETTSQVKMLAQLSESGVASKGMHFALANDLDFANVTPNAYVPVGTVENPFEGTFNGNGHTISNFKIDGKGFTNTGFIGVLGENGRVENINFTNSNVVGSGLYVGTVVATNYGTVTNVSVSGKVSGDGEVLGGITGITQGGTITKSNFTGTVDTKTTGAGITGYLINNGDRYAEISDCWVKGIVTVVGYQSSYSNYEAGGIAGIAMRGSILRSYFSGILQDKIGRHYLGGIAGYSSYVSIRESFNTGAIMAKRTYFGTGVPGADDGDTETGGLVGYISGGELIDCYNAGTIMKSDKSNNVGGLVGYMGVGYSSTNGAPAVMINRPEIRNCYNSGQLVTASSEETRGIIGSTFTSTSYSGPSPIELCISNCYFDNQVMGYDDGLWGRKTAELTSALPEGFDSSKWTSTAGRYPVLATGKGSQAQELSILPIVLRDNDNSTKVKVDFKVPASANATWALNYDAGSQETATETAALKLDGETVTIKDKYSNSALNVSSTDSWTIKLYYLAVVPKLFEGEGTAENPFLMKELKDYKNLHEAVATYAQGHLGDHFAMANDIDFAGTEEFKGIGFGKTNEFKGTFDGRGHSVKGLKYDAVAYDDKGAATTNSTICSGLFAVINKKGTVRNIVMDASNDIRHYSYGGMIAGANFGLIENCRNYANVTGITQYIGGIAGSNMNVGRIVNCYNAGNVNFGVSLAGGITGYNGPGCLVSLCQNDGEVIRKSVNSTTHKTLANTVGGVAGSNYGKIDRCVNNGHIGAFDRVGGITGYASSYNNEGDVTNCINNGIITTNATTLNRGGVVGAFSGDAHVANNYYDASVNVNGGAGNTDVTGITPLSTSEMVEGKMFDGMSADDFDFTAGSYPVLKTFAKETAATSLRNMYVAFAPKQLRTNVRQDVALSKPEGIVFSLAKNDKFKISEGKLIAAIPEGMTLASDSITASLGNFSKGFDITSIPVILTGEGTKEDPYQIKTKEDWNNLANFVESSKWEYPGNFFRLENDIDFAGDSIRLLAVDIVNFQGVLDGAGHALKNYVYFNNNSIKTKLQGPNLYVGKYLGVIGNLGVTGVLKNITFDGSLNGHSYIAGAVCKNYGTIDGVTVKGKLTTNGGSYAAGVSLYNYAGSSLRNSNNYADITSTYSSGAYFCGITYQALEGVPVENCVNYGAMTSNAANAYGIIYDAQGSLKNCVNNGKLYAKTGIISGVVYKLGVNATMEGCSNTVDIDLTNDKKGSIAGVIFTATARTETSDPEAGFIRNCFNTGNIAGASDLFGFGKEILSGWTISDCYNTGDVTSCYYNAGVTTSGNAQGFLNKTGGAKVKALMTNVERCYNTGDVKANYAGTAGLVSEAANMSHISDCYNLGNVYSSSTSGLTFAGIAAKNNGLIERCYNAGDVICGGNAVGGIAGYMATGVTTDPNEIYPAGIVDCFNIGNIVSTYTGTGTQGNAGGLLGYFSTCDEVNPHYMLNCFNSGDVTASMRVGGIAAGAFRPQSLVRNCYNSGKITCLTPDSQGRYYWSGTTFTNNYTYAVNGEDVFMLAGHENCFYDSELNPGAEFRSVPGSRKSTKELASLEISDDYVTTSGYPVLKKFEKCDAALASTSMLLFDSASGDTYTKVTKDIALAAPADTEWTVEPITENVEGEGGSSSQVLKIENGKAIPVSSGTVKLISNYKGYKRAYTLTVEYKSGVDENTAKEVKEVVIYDLTGRKVVNPTAGEVYIVRTIYVDGTVKTTKNVAK